jgi:hypothetical protein
VSSHNYWSKDNISPKISGERLQAPRNLFLLHFFFVHHRFDLRIQSSWQKYYNIIKSCVLTISLFKNYKVIFLRILDSQIVTCYISHITGTIFVANNYEYWFPYYGCFLYFQLKFQMMKTNSKYFDFNYC